ncbi:MAG: hypothetical protein JNJ59_14945 [Deltaproteobacteria bacterium]|nr:hypothetical protein [Deltaproteobacteria bacterium]
MSPAELEALVSDAERIHAELDAFAERIRDLPSRADDVLTAIGLTRAATRAQEARDLLWGAVCGLRAEGDVCGLRAEGGKA